MLKKLKTQENLHIEWFDYLDKTVIASLLHTTHIFMHASTTETFSIVTAEALSTGTPVLASDTGALPELINANNGILVENNPGSWLKGVREIVARQFDCEKIAVQNQNKYSPNEVGRSILSVYNKAFVSGSDT
jgi:glycosyltransferase involved in cell wall biosynthesis